MSLNPISTLNTLTEISSSQDVLMIMDASDTETKQIPISEFNTAIQSTTFPLSGSFSGSFTGDGTGLTGVTGSWDGSHLGDASITGSFTVSSSTSTVDFSNVEGGVSGSFSGSYSGSFNGNGLGLYNITVESASYILSTGVDGPYGMDSILTASYAVSASQALSASSALSSSYALSSSFTSFADYIIGGGGSSIFLQTGSFYATTNDLQITGSLDISGSFSSDTYDIDSGGDTTVEGILNTQGGTRTKVRRITLNGTTAPNILSSDNIIYVDVTAGGTGGDNDLILPTAEKGQEFIFLVKNSGNDNFYVRPANFAYINDFQQAAMATTGLNLNIYSESEISNSQPFPGYVKYHFICINSFGIDRYLMNVNFGKIYSL